MFWSKQGGGVPPLLSPFLRPLDWLDAIGGPPLYRGVRVYKPCFISVGK